MQGRGIISASNPRRLILRHEGSWEASRQWQGEGREPTLRDIFWEKAWQGTKGLDVKDLRLRAHGCLWAFRTKLNWVMREAGRLGGYNSTERGHRSVGCGGHQ